MPRRLLIGTTLVLALAAWPASADVWDTAVDNDDTTTSDNNPSHGTVQVHDLMMRPGPVADEDWYDFRALPRSSYEAVIDGMTGDVSGPLGGLEFDVLSYDGTTILSSATAHGGGECLHCLKSVRFNNDQATTTNAFIRVRSAACGTSCDNSDQYTFKFFETTYSIPRFNNSGTQTTILMINNTRNYTVNIAVHFFTSGGTHQGTYTGALVGHEMLVLNTSTLAYAAGKSGSITVANDGRYGDLTGKAVAVEPATGFTFDTAMSARP